MAINSISGFGGFNNYIPVIPKVDVETLKPDNRAVTTPETSVAAEIPAVSVNEKPVEDTRSKAADLSNVSLTFNKGDDFSFLGSEADINRLDMEKAISDMKKDKVFEDYQFFVGSSDNVRSMFNSEDGKIIKK